MHIKTITKVFEGLIFILLGVVAAGIIVMPFNFPESLALKLNEITEISVFVLFLLLSIPIENIYYYNYIGFKRFLFMKRNLHIIMGILFILLRLLHLEIYLLFNSFLWNMETITSILLSIILIPTVTYSILRINNPDRYYKEHRIFLVLTYIIFTIHLFF